MWPCGHVAMWPCVSVARLGKSRMTLVYPASFNIVPTTVYGGTESNVLLISSPVPARDKEGGGDDRRVRWVMVEYRVMRRAVASQG